MFLEEAKLIKLTGFRSKSKQIAQLRTMGIPFFINASGHPVVPESSVEGRKAKAVEVESEWRPKWEEKPA